MYICYIYRVDENNNYKKRPQSSKKAENSSIS